MQTCPRTWTKKQENDKLLMEIILSLWTSDLKKHVDCLQSKMYLATLYIPPFYLPILACPNLPI